MSKNWWFKHLWWKTGHSNYITNCIFCNFEFPPKFLICEWWIPFMKFMKLFFLKSKIFFFCFIDHFYFLLNIQQIIEVKKYQDQINLSIERTIFINHLIFFTNNLLKRKNYISSTKLHYNWFSTLFESSVFFQHNLNCQFSTQLN
jgi:hypothetical protein